MGTNCAPLVADLFMFCYARGFVLSLSEKTKLILLKHSTPLLDGSLNMALLNHISRQSLLIMKLPFRICDLSYDKRDALNFERVNF